MNEIIHTALHGRGQALDIHMIQETRVRLIELQDNHVVTRQLPTPTTHSLTADWGRLFAQGLVDFPLNGTDVEFILAFGQDVTSEVDGEVL